MKPCIATTAPYIAFCLSSCPIIILMVSYSNYSRFETSSTVSNPGLPFRFMALTLVKDIIGIGFLWHNIMAAPSDLLANS